MARSIPVKQSKVTWAGPIKKRSEAPISELEFHLYFVNDASPMTSILYTFIDLHLLYWQPFKKIEDRELNHEETQNAMEYSLSTP